MNKRFRKLINDIHLWLGFGSGLILFIVCLTGTIYTFRTEIDEFFNKDRYYFEKQAGAALLNTDELIRLVNTGNKGTVTGFSIPAEENRAWSFSIKPSETKGKGNEKGMQVLVNPYSGAIISSGETSTGKFFLTIMKLHRWLLMEQSTGRVIVGIATIIFALLLLSGIILWLPRKMRYWKQGFIILFSGKWKRINHDLHNVAGFYTFPVLLIMALTGLCWSFDWYKNGMSAVLNAPVMQRGSGKPLQSVDSTGTAVTLESVLTSAKAHLPEKGTTRVAMPDSKQGVFTVTKNNEKAFNVIGTDKVSIDQYTGSVIKIEKFSEKKLGEKIAASIKPIHTGEIFGFWSKIIYFICCLIATSLPVTGTLIWWNKRKKK